MARVPWCSQRRSRYRFEMSEKQPIVYEFSKRDACDKYHFRLKAPKVPRCGSESAKSSEIEPGRFVTKRFVSKRFVTNAALVSSNPMTNIRLGTGRGFRYACRPKSPKVGTPSGVRPKTREAAFVEAGSTPR